MLVARQLDSIEELRNSLNSLADPSCPFLSSAWLVPWAQNYLEPRSRNELFAVGVFEDNKIVALAPWFRESSLAKGRVIRFLGDGRACTDYLSILCRPNCAESAADCLANFMTSRTRDWDRLDLDGIDFEDKNTELFFESMQSHGNAAIHEPGMQCWRLPLPDSWDELLASYSKSHRKQIRRVEKRLLADPDFELDWASDKDTLRFGIDTLINLHQQRWNALGEPGCFETDEFSDFLTEASEELFRNNQLRLIWASYRKVPIAVDYCVTSESGIFAYQGGVSPQHLDLQPGRALMIASIKKAIDDGFQFIDFLRGDEEYKAHWRAIPCPIKKLTFVPNRIASIARNKVLDFGRNLKNLVAP